LDYLGGLGRHLKPRLLGQYLLRGLRVSATETRRQRLNPCRAQTCGATEGSAQQRATTRAAQALAFFRRACAGHGTFDRACACADTARAEGLCGTPDALTCG
jgi:hypothetical protein